MLKHPYPYDYRKLYQAIGLEVHGALGKWWIHKTYRQHSNRYGQYVPRGHIVVKWAYPYNPRTYNQQFPRNIFAYAVANWQGFDQSTKSWYNQKVGTDPLYGYNYYISLYLRANLTVPVTEKYLLLENGARILLETGGKIKLEQ